MPVSAHGYLYAAAAVQPARGPPFVWPSARRTRLLGQLKELGRRLEQRESVLRVLVFRAIVMPPTARFSAYVKEHGSSLHVADFDAIMLIETSSPESARQLQTDPAYGAVIEAMRSEAQTVHAFAARNVRRIADIDPSVGGLFLFNHFAADDAAVMMQLWDYLAGWYVVETGLNNSVALSPLQGEQSDCAIVNWARWDGGSLPHFWKMLSKRSFWRYVPPNLEANRAASMPIYCRLA
jgi:hypothetical protein